MIRSFPRVVLAALALTFAATPAAQAAWQPTQTISIANGGGQWPTAATGADGTVYAVWFLYQDGLRFAERPAGGSWSTPVTIAAGTDASGARIVVGDQGDVTLTWTRSITTPNPNFPGPFGGTTTYSVQTATRPAGGSWSAPETLSLSGEQAFAGALAIGQDGRVVTAFQSSTGGTVQYASRPAGGAWSTPTPISVSGGHMPDIEIDDEGDVTAVWRVNYTIHSRDLPAGGSWSATRTHTGNDAAYADLELADDGDATLTWMQNQPWSIHAARRADGDTEWTVDPVIASSGTNNTVYSPSLAVSGDGTSTVRWTQFTGAAYSHFVATRSGTGAWGQPEDLGGSPSDPGTIAMNRAGDTIVTWRRIVGNAFDLVSRVRSAGQSAWSAVEVHAGSTGYEISPAMDEQGNPHVVWQEGGVVKASGDDVSGPLMRQVDVPATGDVGATMTFSVSPLDVWATLGATTWSFGDGTDATGTSVTHAYTTPGPKTVTVTSADALGHEETETRTVTVAAAPVVPVVEPDVEEEEEETTTVPVTTTPVIEEPAKGEPLTSDPAPVAAPLLPGCDDRRSLTINWSVPKKVKLRSVTVYVDGSPLRKLPGRARQVTVDISSSEARVAEIRIVAVTKKGDKLSTVRTRRLCGATQTPTEKLTTIRLLPAR